MLIVVECLAVVVDVVVVAVAECVAIVVVVVVVAVAAAVHTGETAAAAAV